MANEIRIALLNGANKSYDFDLSKILESIASAGVATGCLVETNKVNTGRGFCSVTRGTGLTAKTFNALFQIQSDVTIDTTGTKKVRVEFDQAKVNDGSLNSPDGLGVASINTGASYPTKNYVKLASITGGVITDERDFVKVQQGVLPTTFNHSIKELNDVLNFTTPTTKKFLVFDVAENKRTSGDVEFGDIPNENRKDYELGETIADKKVVSLLPDGKIYKLLGNKRTFTGAITGETSTKSCLLPNNKIATVGRSGNTLTLYIGNIDYDTNEITYGSGVQVTTNNNDGNYFITPAGVDSLVISYGTSGIAYGNNGICAGRAVSISDLVPTIGSETTIRDPGYLYGSTANVGGCYVASGKVCIGRYEQTNGATDVGGRICSVSGTTLTVGGFFSLGYNSYNRQNNSFDYVSDNIIAWTYHLRINSGGDTQTNIQLYSISGTTPTGGGGITLFSNPGNNTSFVCTNGTHIFAISNATNIKKCSYSGNTLTQIYSKTVTSCTGIVLNGKNIGVIISNTIKRYNDILTDIVERNIVDYGISLTQILSKYSTNYHIIALTTNPSTVYKIANENRNIVGYLPTGGDIADTKTVVLDGGVINGFVDLIPGEQYYVTFSTGAIGLTGDMLFGKAISTTEIKQAIAYLA